MKNLKSLYIKYLPQLLIAVFVGLFILGLSILYQIVVVNRQSNDECIWEPHNSPSGRISVLFDKVKTGGVTWNAGIRNGDTLLAINNVKVKTTLQAQDILNEFPQGSMAPYTYSHNGKILNTIVYVKKLIQFPNLAFSLLALFWLIVGIIVALAKPEGYIQKLFFSIGACYILFLSVILLHAPATKVAFSFISYYFFLDILWSLGGFFLPFLIIEFFCLFPRPFKFAESKYFKRIMFILPSIAFIVAYLYRMIFIVRPRDFSKYNAVVQIANWSILAALAIGFILLSIKFFRLSRKERAPLFVIIVFYLLAVLSFLYTTLIASILVDSFYNSPEYYAPIILIALIPIAFGISIFKYQLMDVSVVVKNTIIYGAATIMIAAIYIIIVFLLGQQFGLMAGNEYRNIVAAISFVAFALIFQSTKDKFQNMLTKSFYPEQFSFQQIISGFSNSVVSIVGEEKIMDTTSSTFVDWLKITRFGIMLKNENCFETRRNFGFAKLDDISGSQHLSVLLKEQMRISGKPYIERDNFREFFNDSYNELVTSEIYAIVPMVISSQIKGLMLLGLKHSGSQFTSKDLTLISAAANQAGLAIENARLYQSEVKRLTLEKDIENARTIQKSLLPKCLPSFNGASICGEMIPAMQVGGDYYDIIPAGKDKFYIVVGDVSGKGLSASLYMSKIQTMMRLYCVGEKSPKEILIDVNKNMYESLNKNCFITASLALIDTSKNKMLFCRAGHLPLISVYDSNTVFYKPEGLGLGLEEGKIFSETLEQIEIALIPGQVHAFLSDGLSEAMNEKKEMLGLETIASNIIQNSSKSASDITEGLVRLTKVFRGPAEQNDDITIVMLKIEEKQ
jgi:sigma-B regulation protein RsbU (phosphoserine phosphatase)